MDSYYFSIGITNWFRGYLSMRGVLSGLNAWVLQRASAVYLLLFILIMPTSIFYLELNTYNAWHAFILSPLVAISWILFFVSLLAHAWVGIRDVVVDYVHPFAIRLIILSLLAFYLIAMMIWVLRFLLLHAGVSA